MRIIIITSTFVLDFDQNWFDGTNFIEFLFSVMEAGAIFVLGG